MRGRVVAAALAGAPVAAAAVWAAQQERPAEAVAVAGAIPVRLARDAWAAGITFADYKVSLRGLAPGSAERAAALHGCHERGAQRLQALAFANKGVYIKLGQHLAQLDHLIPSEYVQTMRASMLARCPVSPFEEVRRVVEEELGRPLAQAFPRFEERPVASASLAQVHRAWDEAGRKVAVKVQHQGLRESAAADLATVSALARLIGFLTRGAADYSWLVDEIRTNAPRELDFELEAANAARCRANLAASRVRGRVHIPRVDHASRRLLVMEFCDGVEVCDAAGLAGLGVDRADLAALVADCFNEQVYAFGFCHVDPHQANLLVRKRRGRAELVLLDHGLYRELSTAFRLEYAHLWQSLIFGDEAGIRRHAEEMNAGGAAEFFAALLTMRPWDEIKRPTTRNLYLPQGGEERERMKAYAQEHANDISAMLQRIPRPLLLLLKLNDCLRTIDACLGQPVNTFTATARACSRALAAARPPGAAAWLRSRLTLLGVELRIAALRLAVWWHGWAAGGPRGRGPEPEALVVSSLA